MNKQIIYLPEIDFSWHENKRIKAKVQKMTKSRLKKNKSRLNQEYGREGK